MENKRNRKTNKIIIIFIIVLVITIGIVIIMNMKNEIKNENGLLNGTFIYDEDIKYIFDGKGMGKMLLQTEEYEFVYNIVQNELNLDFTDENIHDANYTFEVQEHQLKLIGGEGTTGGEYTLNKEK